jgi:hypothetical protein
VRLQWCDVISLDAAKSMTGLPLLDAVCGVQGTNPKEGYRVHKSSAALLRLICVVDQSP